MAITIGKIVSLLIAIFYVVIAFVIYGFSFVVLELFVFLIFIVSLIWFPEEMGDRTVDSWSYGSINKKSAPILVSFMGWFLLIGMPVIIYFITVICK